MDIFKIWIFLYSNVKHQTAGMIELEGKTQPGKLTGNDVGRTYTVGDCRATYRCNKSNNGLRYIMWSIVIANAKKWGDLIKWKVQPKQSKKKKKQSGPTAGP